MRYNPATVGQYFKGLRVVLKTGPEIYERILQAHYENEPCSWDVVRKAVGYRSSRAVNLHYGKLAHDVIREAGITWRHEKNWIMALVDWADEPDEHGWTRFVLRKSVIEALRRLGCQWVRRRR